MTGRITTFASAVLCRLPASCVALLIALFPGARVEAVGPLTDWDRSPYRIEVTLAIRAPGELADLLAAELPPYLLDRAGVAVGPLWSLETNVAGGALRQQLLDWLDAVTEEQLPPRPAEADKRVVLTVRATPLGYELAGREYDGYLQRWGPTIRRSCRQRAALPEQLFELLDSVVAPVAQIQLIPDNDEQVMLLPRGAALAGVGNEFGRLRPGEVLLPILRRTTRDGSLVPDGIQPVPWTYLRAADDEQDPPRAHVYSGTRRPLGVRRRGRIEQVAIALRGDPAETTVRLHARTDPDLALVGYDVYAQGAADRQPSFVGQSDETGRLVLAPDDARLLMLYVKSGGQVLAGVPIVLGAERHVDLPLPDDPLRLRAESRLSALREDLIDVVARRNILLTRARHQIEESNFDRAKQLLDQLDQLPGRTYFSRAISNESRQYRSDDPLVQRKIDQLVSATQSVLGQFFDPRPVAELRDQVLAARKSDS